MGLVKGKTEITWCASMNECANMKSAMNKSANMKASFEKYFKLSKFARSKIGKEKE